MSNRIETNKINKSSKDEFASENDTEDALEASDDNKSHPEANKPDETYKKYYLSKLIEICNDLPVDKIKQLLRLAIIDSLDEERTMRNYLDYKEKTENDKES